MMFTFLAIDDNGKTDMLLALAINVFVFFYFPKLVSQWHLSPDLINTIKHWSYIFIVLGDIGFVIRYLSLSESFDNAVSVIISNFIMLALINGIILGFGWLTVKAVILSSIKAAHITNANLNLLSSTVNRLWLWSTLLLSTAMALAASPTASHWRNAKGYAVIASQAAVGLYIFTWLWLPQTFKYLVQWAIATYHLPDKGFALWFISTNWLFPLGIVTIGVIVFSIVSNVQIRNM